MKVSELNPGWCPTAIEGVHQFWFTCPTCGPPYRITVCVTSDPALRNSVWHWNHNDPLLCPWEGRLTITPSIWNHHHGNKKSCDWHGSITNGEVIPPP